jgi:hypothetical protein
MTLFQRIIPCGSLHVWLVVLMMASCQKNAGTAGGATPPATPDPASPNGSNQLIYADSVVYLRPQAEDYMVTPINGGAGRYSGFPEGLQIDGNSGAINVNKSETGLRYRVSFVPKGTTDTFSTMITVSGVNFLDGFYNLAKGDSIAHPIYNGWSALPIPGLNGGSVFDEGATCNRQGCVVSMTDGRINLAETVRNGVFGSKPSSNARQQFHMAYRIADKSQESLNGLDIKIYYFATMNDVSQEVYDIIASRQGTILGASASPSAVLHQTTGRTVSVTGTQTLQQSAKPRPPCIFIIGR